MKFIKISLYIVLGIVVIAMAGAGVFIVTFDANEYKPLISEQVKQQTGRDFTLGDIKPSVFPWLGLELQQLSLGNAKGFKAEKMVQIERLDVRVELMPLFKQEIRVDTLRVHGLQASLEKNKNGRTNWDDILEKQAETSAPVTSKQDTTTVTSSEEKPTPPLALMINGVDIKEANINWDDALTSQKVLLDKFNLTTGAIRLGQPLSVKLSSQIKLAEPQADFNVVSETRINFDPETQKLKLGALMLTIEATLQEVGISNARIALNTQLDADLKNQKFILPGFTLDVSATGEAIPNNKIKASLKGAADIDVLKQTAKFKKITVETLGLKMQTQLAVTKLIDSPAIKGKFNLSEFNPSGLAKKLAIELPETKSKQVLQQASLGFDFETGDQWLKLSSLKLKLDESTVNARVSVRDFDKPEITYALMMDKIQLDNYLAPQAEVNVPVVASNAGKSTAPASKTDIPIDLPIPLLKSLNLEGVMDVKSIKAFDQVVSNLKIKTQAKQGLIKIPVINAELLQGKVVASAQLDVRKNTPRYQFRLDAKSLKADSVVNPLLQDMLGEKTLAMSGAVNLNANITSKGASVNQLMANSNGQFKLNMGKAKLHGVDAEYFVRKAVATFLEEKKKQVPKEWKGAYQPKETTALKKARASAVIRNGVVENKDLLLDSARFKVTGKGKVNLPRERLNYRVVVDVKPTSTKTAGERLLDIPMPVFVKGSFTQPKISIDTKVWLKSVGKELKEEVKKEIKQAVKKEKAKQKQKLKKEADKKLDKYKDKYKDKLKGLFGR